MLASHSGMALLVRRLTMFCPIASRRRRNLIRRTHPRLDTLETRMLLSAAVFTDQLDYAPGSTAHITAASDGGLDHNFLPGETIRFHIARTDGIAIVSPPAVTDWNVTDGVGVFTPYQDPAGIWTYPDTDGQADGAVGTDWYVDPQFAGASLMVTATGQTSGESVQAAFTDAGNATISGQVVNDANGNGVKDTGETSGVPGATITLYLDSNSNGTYDPGTDQQVTGVTNPVTTPSDGSWSFASIAKNKTYFVIETNFSGYVSTNAIAGSGGGTTTKDNNSDRLKFVSDTNGGTSSNNYFLDTTAAVTTTTVTSSANPSTYGQSITFTADVTSSYGTPGGTVTFKDGASTLGTGTLASGQATYTTSSLTAAGHSITAVYAANGGYAGSTSSSLSQTVNKAPLTITATIGQSKVYGAADPTLIYTASGLVNGDTTSIFTGALARTAGGNVGSYAINLGTLAAGSNYTVSLAGTPTFAVTTKTLTPTITLNNKPYDGATTATTIASRSLAGIVGSDDVSLGSSGAVGAFSNKNVNAYSVTITGLSLSGTTAGNYALSSTSTTASANITAKSLTITASAQSKTYGATLALGTTAFVVGSGLVSPESVTAVTLTANGGTAATDAAGSYTITPSAATGTNGFLASNYTITYNTGVLTVNKAHLVVTADNQSRSYGAANPTLTATLSGFVNGEGLITSGVNGSPLLSTTATPATPVGTAPITVTQGSLSAANYDFLTFNPGTLTITTPATPTAPVLDAGSDSGAPGDNVTNVAKPLLTGSAAQPNAVITVYDGSTALGVTVAAGDGRWSFAISTALTDGVHVLTATAGDGVGHASANSASLTLTIDTAAPAVAAMTVNGDRLTDALSAAQRSMVNSVTVRFSERVFGNDAAFTNALTLLTWNGSAWVTASVAFTVSAWSGDPTGQTLVVNFGGSLADGKYQLAVNNANLHDLAGNAVAAPANLSFFRLFGDFDGNGVVNNADMSRIQAALGKRLNQTGYAWYFDYDVDGLIGATDLAQVRARLGKTMN